MSNRSSRAAFAIVVCLLVEIGVPVAVNAQGAPSRSATASDSISGILGEYLRHRRLVTTVPVVARICSDINGAEDAAGLLRDVDATITVSAQAIAECSRQPVPRSRDAGAPVLLIRSIEFRADTARVYASVWHGASLRIDETAVLIGPRRGTWGVVGLTFHAPVHSDRIPRGG